MSFSGQSKMVRSRMRLLAGISGLLLLWFAIPPSAAQTGPARTAKEKRRIAAVTRPTRDFTKPEPYERRPGGASTTFKQAGADSFSQPSANLPFAKQFDFRIGNGVFRKLWVSSPASTKSSDGLGPLFNARSCQRCHLKDGRGHVPVNGEAAISMFLRLSIPPRNAAERDLLRRHRTDVIPEPTYGGQLQNFSVQGVLPEGSMVITYDPEPVTLADGTLVTLRAPRYSVRDLRYGPLHPKVMLSPRVASPMIGLGLLEMIPAQDILANADPDDRDGDGISGRPNRVWSVTHQKVMLGRFGWKAGQPTIAQQSAGAFQGDIGLSTPLFAKNHAGDCTKNQQACRNAPHGDDSKTPEVGSKLFALVVFYSQHLAVPARRDVDKPAVLRGKKLFYQSGCASCHRPKFVTRRDPTRPAHSFQLIWPYSDMLLHDMGEGLADHRPEGAANGREWRTTPLWGIGLTKIVNPRATFLHDGRARTLMEAILWHGGEAAAAQQKVVKMSKQDRDDLIAFLRSL